MDLLREKASAKINLTLKVIGKRGDGFHEICSLVAFAVVGDVVELDPSKQFSISVHGPFAEALAGQDNLIENAEQLFRIASPGAQSGAFRLYKRLPVAAGLGGGSADAAAALRLLAKVNPGRLPQTEIRRIAAEIGSDVPACLGSSAALMHGRGEELELLENFPAMPAVLVNPGTNLAAGDIYAALDAEPLSSGCAPGKGVNVNFRDLDSLVCHIRETGNDLQPQAVKRAPSMLRVLEALSHSGGCLVAQMSGSGPTCFALYRSGQEAAAASDAVAEEHPEWWVKKTEIR